jgi:son of sevenless-like protein
MQRFQVPYNLKAIPEVQTYLTMAFNNSQHHGDLQDLYRRRCAYIYTYTIVALILIHHRSLLVEPKQPADTTPATDMRNLFNWTSRSQTQQLQLLNLRVHHQP